MAWPKGKSRKFETKADVLPPVKVDQTPEWKPEPDMGRIKPPPPGDSLCTTCNHKGEVHYGGPKGWCNTGGCKCQEFAKA